MKWGIHRRNTVFTCPLSRRSSQSRPVSGTSLFTAIEMGQHGSATTPAIHERFTATVVSLFQLSSNGSRFISSGKGGGYIPKFLRVSIFGMTIIRGRGMTAPSLVVCQEILLGRFSIFLGETPFVLKFHRRWSYFKRL